MQPLGKKVNDRPLKKINNFGGTDSRSLTSDIRILSNIFTEMLY